MRRSWRSPFITIAVFTLGVCTTLAADSLPQLEEVVVTAEKREASVQEISQAVTVLSGEELDRYSISSFVDLNSIVPGLNVVKNEGTRLVLSMRGIGNEANQNVIASPAVSYHVDGVYIASPHAIQTELLDVERLEVLRGPQGTLFGQNSTGGAINVIAQQPGFGELTGSLAFDAGSFSTIQTKGSVNIPLAANAALRLALASNVRNGYSQNAILDQALDDSRSVAVRARLYVEPTADLTLDFALQIAADHRNGPAQKGILDPTPDPRKLAQDFPQFWDLDASFASAIIEYQRDEFVFKSVSSLQNDTLELARDNDRHNLNSLPRFTVLPAAYDPWFNGQRTITQEFQLVSTSPLFGRIDWIAGYFFFRTDVELAITEYIDFGADGVFDPITQEEIRMFVLGDYGFISESDLQRKANSIFLEGVYNVNSRTRFIGGLRLSQDHVGGEITNFYGRSGTDTQSASSRTLTGRVSFQRDLNDVSMLYVSVVRGYKPGGSNLTFGREDEVAPIVVLPTFKEEIVETVEIGLKSDFLAQRLRLNAALFNYAYTDLQYQATDPEVFEGGVNNIPASEIMGAEFEAMALLTNRLDLDLRVSLLNTKISSHHRSLDNVQSDATTNTLLAQGFALFGPEIQRARAANIVDVIGNELAKSPHSTVSLSADYVRNLDGLGQFSGSLQLHQRGAYHFRIFNNPDTDRVPAYTVLNALGIFEPSEGNWRVSVRALNITNKDGVNARFTDVFGVGASSEELIAPRRFLIGWSMSF